MSLSRPRKRPWAASAAITADARTRGRPTAVTSDSPWTSLPGDLLGLIAWRVLAGDMLDYVRFRAVCTDPRFHPRRWMMLPEGHGFYPGHGKLRGYVRFFNLDTGTFVRVRLPLFRDHCALDSADGLLLLQRDQDTAIRLLHPFTGDIADLPPLATVLSQLQELIPYPEQKRWYFIRTCVCASVSCNAGVTTVMLAFHHLSRVAYATSLDRRWTMASWEIPSNFGVMSSQGKLHTVPLQRTTQIFQMDPPLQDDSSPPPPPKLIATCPADKLYSPVYLVECDSEILVVGHSEKSWSHILLVYKLADLILERFVPVKSIGDKALFIRDRTLSVSSKTLPTVMANTVVYNRDEEFSQYHLSVLAFGLLVLMDAVEMALT